MRHAERLLGRGDLGQRELADESFRSALAATVKGTLGFILGRRREWELDAFVEQAVTDLARQTPTLGGVLNL